jgi:hypothetical protein
MITLSTKQVEELMKGIDPMFILIGNTLSELIEGDYPMNYTHRELILMDLGYERDAALREYLPEGWFAILLKLRCQMLQPGFKKMSTIVKHINYLKDEQANQG